MGKWAYDNHVKLSFARPGKPVDNAFIESFNGSFRDECLKVNWSLSIQDGEENGNAVDNSPEVHADHPSPICESSFRNRTEHAHPCIVEKQVDCPIFLQRLFGKRIDILNTRYINPNRKQTRAYGLQSTYRLR